MGGQADGTGERVAKAEVARLAARVSELERERDVVGCAGKGGGGSRPALWYNRASVPAGVQAAVEARAHEAESVSKEKKTWDVSSGEGVVG